MHCFYLDTYLVTGSKFDYIRQTLFMVIPSKNLIVKKSTLPGAGKGLFTKICIPKGEKIVEYKGKITNWNDADHQDGENLYIFYINRNHVINASQNKTMLARYANDARGISRAHGVNNNCVYFNENNRIFIKATRDIYPGAEILVGYGKAYWDVIKKLKV